MNSYLNELSRLLANSISPEEFNNVMQYYTEYFADAGIENQEEVIKELGTPEELANKIIEEYNNRSVDEEPQGTLTQNTPAQTHSRPRRRLAKGWIVLIVIGGILVSLPIIITCIKKSTDKIGKVFSKIDVVEQEYKVVDEFNSIVIDISVGNVEIINGDEYALEYVLGEDMSMNLNDDALIIQDKSFKSVFTSDLTNLTDTYIKIYVPEDGIVDMGISVDVGNVSIKGVEFGYVDIEADTGDVSIESDSNGGDVYIAADIGDVSIKGFLACDMEVEADIGKVNITSYYSSSSYSYNIDSDLGEEIISDEGGVELDDKYDIDVTSDIGNVKMVFCDN